MTRIFRKKIFVETGVTLLELVVALGLFSVVMLSATQIFNMVMQAQRDAIISQQMQEDMRYLMEIMTKEVRMAQVDKHGTCVDANKVYYTNGNYLDFMNIEGQCVRYFEQGGRFMVRRGGTTEAVTSDNVEISNLNFIQFGEVPLEQPRIVINADIEIGGEGGVPRKTVDFQTSISTRHYE